jgi:hypothetical protein
MSYFSRNTTQPLIKNNKAYAVHSHIITIQSEDRDVLKWPNSSQFEIELPIDYKNICAITVIDMQIPNTFYTFNTRRQNTKLILSYNLNNYYITIGEGSYTGEQIANELTTKINAQTYSNGLEVSVQYNVINKKLYFFSNAEFILDFTIDPYCNVDVDISNCAVCPIPPSHYARSNRPGTYLTQKSSYSKNCNPTTCNDVTGENRYNKSYQDAYVINHGPTAYDKRSEWGLGNFIGFNKEEYYTKDIDSSDYAWIDISNILPYSGNAPSLVIKSELTVNICDFDNIFMEIDNFNCIDELEPYCFNTNAANQVKYANYKGKKVPICCNNQQPNKTYNGKHNAAFAIIPVGGTVDYIPGDSMISGVFDSIPPIPRIKKLKFKFRWHDGTLVDFNCCNINLVIQLQELINDMNKPPTITNINSLVF